MPIKILEFKIYFVALQTRIFKPHTDLILDNQDLI